MKLYHSLRPHPKIGAGREVRITLAEKGLAIETQDLDMMTRENRKPEYLAKNPTGQLPFLELDDGHVISESIAICELLEDLHPDPPIVGATPVEKAETRMWLRRIELGIAENIVNGFRFGEGRAFWEGRGRIVAEAADGLKALARDKLEWLDAELRARPFVAGTRFTLADVVLVTALDFGEMVGQPLDPALEAVAAWKRRVDDRPSVRATLEG